MTPSPFLAPDSLRLKKELAGTAAVWVAGYSNDVMGYVPSRRVREEGGYEAAEAMRYSRTHPAPWAPALLELPARGRRGDSAVSRPGGSPPTGGA
ncbi:MAG: hypothetical protein LC745_02090 [Planctomycetia bacterium]|nr:hypothetical protein [Planctomycetia bacterium]